MKNEKLNKIKKHLVEKKEIYIVGGVSLIVGVSVGLLIKQTGNKSNMTRIFSPGDNNSIQVNIPKPGNSGNMIYCHQNNTFYPSQRSAAKALNLNESSISQYILGKWPAPKGYTFDKIAENGESLAN